MRSASLLALLLLGACVGRADGRQAPAARETRPAAGRKELNLPPPLRGPKAVRLVAEAEDFKVESGSWSVLPYPRNYFASTFAVTFLSRMACLSAPAQPAGDAVASQRVSVPEDGEYRVFARYEAPYNFSAEFTLEIEQAGRPVLTQVYGRLSDVKIWGLAEPRREPMKRFWWGASENIAWQEAGPVRLKRGDATLRLRAGPQRDAAGARAAAAERHVDAIVLTNDGAGIEAQKKTRYLEMDGWLVQDGDLFVRFTNPKDGLGPVVPVVEPLAAGQHSPYAVHVRDWPTTRVLRSGRLSDAAYVLAGPRSSRVGPGALAPVVEPGRFAAIPDDEFLEPGERSGWVPLGNAVDALNDSQWTPKALYPGGSKEKRVDLEVEFGVPDDRGGVRVLRSLRVQGTPGLLSPVTFVIPGNVGARPVIRTQLEALQWLNAEVAKFPARGSVPKRFPIYGVMGFSNALAAPGALGAEARTLAIALGDNTATRDAPRSAIATHWRLPQVEKGYAEAEKKGTLGSIGIVSYGDEIRIEPGKDDVPDAAAFAAFLRGKGVANAAELRFSGEPGAPGYYYSRLYGFERRMDAYATATRWLESRMGRDVRTGINYAPHANYLVDDLHWVRPFKSGALTLPWSEDYVWQIPEFSPQVTGYLVSGMRAGAKYHDLSMLMYVMPHSPGNVPRDFRLSFYAAVAHGATKIHYFSASPLAVGTTENYVATEDLGMWRAIRDTTHDAGVFEDYVLDARVRPARIGLLLSSVDEIRTGDSNSEGGIHNQERKALYYALRHAQLPVDFLTEDDVLEGRAKDVAVLYVTQQFLHSRALAALAAWVEGGGTLVAACGGGFFDELGRDNPAAHALYGVKAQSLSKDPALPMILAKQDLPPARVLDHAAWGQARAEVIAWKQALTPSDGRVVGRFGDGTPAIVERVHGKGRAVLFGFLPGIAYLKSGLPLRPVDRSGSLEGFDHFLPTAMDAGLRQALTDAFLPASFVRPVEASEPLVEATLLEAPALKRLAIPLMNWTGRPQAALRVRLPGLATPRRVRSVERGALQGAQLRGAFEVTLPLDVADMLLVDLQ